MHVLYYGEEEMGKKNYDKIRQQKRRTQKINKSFSKQKPH